MRAGAGTLQVSVDAGEQYVPPPVLSADATAGAQDASLPTTEEQYSRYLDVLVSGAVVYVAASHAGERARARVAEA